MGFRLRKSVKAGPFRINFSKKGVGWSVGTKGIRYTKRADGKSQTTYSIPRTGISYVETHKKSNNIKHTNANNISNYNKNSGCLKIILIIIFFPFVIMYWFFKAIFKIIK